MDTEPVQTFILEMLQNKVVGNDMAIFAVLEAVEE